MLLYDSTDVSEGKDVNDDDENSRLCIICHFKYFQDIGFKYKQKHTITVTI